MLVLAEGDLERELLPLALADLARQVAGLLASPGDQDLRRTLWGWSLRIGMPLL